MRTANPALSEKTFLQERVYSQGDVMTIQGAVNKTFILLALALLSASWIWGKFFQTVSTVSWETAAMTFRGPITIWSTIGAIGGFIVAMITIFQRQLAPIMAPIYALLEGLFLGSISALMEFSYPGIVLQAVMLTFGTLFCLLLAYKSGWIKPTENFKLGVVAATGGIALVYFISIVLGFFGMQIPFIHESGPIGIGFSLFIVVIAALNLVLDFDFIESGAQMGVPKYMEWYAAFGLMVTLVWLYLEILRLLAKLRGRD